MSLVRVETGEIVPEPGADLLPDGWCDNVVVPWLATTTDGRELAEAAAKIDGLRAAYETIRADTLELVKARRHVELRWAELHPRQRGGRGRKNPLPTAGSFLNERAQAEVRKLADRRVRVIEMLSSAEDADDVARAALLRTINHGKNVVQSLTNEWHTPAKYLAAARAVLGGIDLDPASCAEANETVQAARFLVEDDDGLTFEWHGRVWLNPPYGRLAGPFVSYLVDEYDAANVTAAVTLVNAHCTDTSWFQRLWPHTLCFTHHRIDFAAGTEDRSGSTHGSVFAYLGPDPELFAKHFAEFGAVVRRWP